MMRVERINSAKQSRLQNSKLLSQPYAPDFYKKLGHIASSDQYLNTQISHIEIHF